MPVSAGVVYVDIAPQVAKSFGSDIEKQVTGPVEDSGKRVGGSLTKVAGLIGSAFAAKGIFDFGKSAVEAATESNKIAAQTEAVIKSTGGAAKVTASQIGDLATAISNKTGVDDEAIQSASNLLLTFTNLKNGVGKSNDVFNQATKIAVDMGAALGGDASSNAIQLGKALNDPVQGISALARVGVTFTDQQKEQIKTMVATGNTMGAQKVILAELNKEFGGSAEAQATAGDKLKVVWGNVQEQIGNILLPILGKVATFLADNLPVAMTFAQNAFQRLGQILTPVIGFVRNVVAAFQEFGLAGGDFAQTIDVLVGGGGKLTPVIQSMFTVVENVTNFIKDHFVPILVGLGITVAALVAPLATLTAAFIYAYNESDTFRGVVEAIANFVEANLHPVLAALATVVLVAVVPAFIAWAVAAASAAAAQIAALAPVIALTAVIAALVAGVVYAYEHFQIFRDVVDTVMTVIGTIIRAQLDVILGVWHIFSDQIVSLAGIGFNLVRSSIENVLGVIRGIIQVVTGLITGDWGKAWDGLKSIVSGVWDQITNLIRTAIDTAKSLFGGLVGDIVNAFLSIPGKIANVGKDILGKLIPDIPGSGLVKGALGAIGLHFDQGGIVPGPIGQAQVAVVHGGEKITPANEVRGVGSGPLIGGDLVLNAAKMSPTDVSAELAWLRRTSGR